MKPSPRMPPRTVRPALPTVLVWMFAIFASVLLAGCAGRQVATSAPTSRLVILVSIDGLPASMLGNGTMPTLDRLAAEGVHARWMKPSFPTMTFPNHYTLVTGLRPDHHGIVHNDMLDPALGIFRSKSESAKDGRWWGGEPIWATLQKQAGIAAIMFWPGSEAEIAGHRPRMFRAFDKTLSPAVRMEQVLSWTDLPPSQRPQLILAYFDKYDITAHESGSHAPTALAALREIDAALAMLEAGLHARGLHRRTDLIVLSDHGMADVPRDNVSIFEDRLDPAAYDITWWGMLVGITPKPGQTGTVERAFLGRQDHYRCWRKSELPPEWHYGSHPRIPPIVCQSDTGWRVQGRNNNRWPQAVKGEHGFAPEDPTMRAVFAARGPSFRHGVVLPPFDNIDVYPLLAHLLKIEPAANDGELTPLQAALEP
ncbi:MAG: alkaline phosphatase family protein [Lysobacter sp.]|nr:alkaline phosphatase family protein [Lysobacter sp.]